MKLKYAYLLLLGLLNHTYALAQAKPQQVPADVMQKVYEEVKTPHKYGLVLVTDDNCKKMDCPSMFRKNGK